MDQVNGPTAATAPRRRLRPLRRPVRGGEPGDRSAWTRGRVLSGLAALSALLLVFHRAVPNTPGRLGSLLETFLPWLGLAVPLLLVSALLRRSALALVAVTLPAAVWGVAYVDPLLSEDTEAYDLVAVQHNVSDVNPDPLATARALAREQADLIALEELTPASLPVYEKALARGYPHRAVEGSVGLWSRHPLSDIRPLDIRPEGVGEGWKRGLRSTAHTPVGEVAVLVAHLPSVRVGWHGFGTARRDESADLLGSAVAGEQTDRLILLGDLNSTVADRGLSPVTSQLAHGPADFPFSWPAGLPVSRIDHVMARSGTVGAVRTLAATGSDHLPVAAGITFGPRRPPTGTARGQDARTAGHDR
ncbi:endonuclease/exonuclease/phosphatase family protein [Streptomyces fructofermentans]|uniref:endonuclease/exonuclease/phosphatase family protein n=1 Tax=Streptomyces fructofermentans TaxID=152141 RepID=UPI0037B39705